MASTVTYRPACHCFCCINDGKQVTATRQVVKGGKTYRTCDGHYEVVDGAASIDEALRQIRKQRRGGAV